MTYLYNQLTQKKLRQELRRNMPQPEKLLWWQLRGKQMRGIKFRRQYSVGRYVVDFYSPEKRLAIEIDGESHFVEHQPEYDINRQKYIEACGIKFLRFTNSDICENIEGVLDRIAEAV